MPAVVITQAFEICLRHFSAHQTQISNPTHFSGHHLKSRFCPLIQMGTETSQRYTGQSTAWLFICVCLQFPVNRYTGAAPDPDLHYPGTMQQPHRLFYSCHPGRCHSTKCALAVCAFLFHFHAFCAWCRRGSNTSTVQSSPLGMIYVPYTAALVEIILIYTILQPIFSSS